MRNLIPAQYKKWPDNLVYKLFYNDFDDIIDTSVFPVTDDQVDGIYYALDTISEREKNMMLRHFRDGMTYEEVGKEHGISRSRVQQIVSKGIRKSRNKARLMYVRLGLKGNTERLDGLKELIKQFPNLDRDSQIKSASRISLHDVELPSRVRNTLLRQMILSEPETFCKIPRFDLERCEITFDMLKTLGIECEDERLWCRDKMIKRAAVEKKLMKEFYKDLV